MNFTEYNFTKKYIIEEVYNLYRKGYSDEEIYTLCSQKYTLEDIADWIEITNYLYI